MRRLTVWVSGGLLLVAVGVSGWSRAGDGEDNGKAARPRTQFTWYGLGGSSSNKTPVKKTLIKETPPTKVKTDAPAKPAPRPLSLAEQRAIEEVEYRRRIEVCDRLMEIAVRNNDKVLQEQAQSLTDRAWEVYQQRTAGLTSVYATDLDETVLEKNLLQEAKLRDLKTRGGVPRRAPSSEFGGDRAGVEGIKR